MRRILIYMVLLQLAMVFASCEKEILPYKGKEGVYFAVQHGAQHLPNSWPFQPYSDVDFVRIGKNTVDFTIKVMITGPVKDYERTFKMEVNPDSTTAIAGKHYEAVKSDWTIPAGSVSANVTVRLNRTPDLEEKPVTLGLKLIETEDFALSFPEWDAIPGLDAGTVVKEFDAGLHTLRINDVMIQPAVWSGSIQPGNRESGLFGVFTRKKMEFLSENLGLTYEDFSSTTTMPMARMFLVANDATAILIKRFNEKNPVLEDDGRLMWMGSVPWTSIIGVPWVPGP
ncbi:DUF4843 domain-containing protein [Pedobacter faecalis]|uniref:DUF4843 domain-containing protein n=1 Tax=Pedobacter faecalis TaxID=3041495 RepID=UPI00254BFD98|nr:DUF4843 domain-containing protein [Pedobacter sp. ELA7]